MKAANKGLENVPVISVMDVGRYTRWCLSAGEIIILMGEPGIGKTASVVAECRKMAEEQDCNFVLNPTPEQWDDPKNMCLRFFIASQVEEVDINGAIRIRVKDDGEAITEYTRAEFFPKKGRGWIFCDELPNARPQVQNALQSVFLEHMAGNFPISKDIHFILAGNEPQHNCGTYNIPAALRNRLIWFSVQRPSIEAWLLKNEEIGNKINPTLGSWLLSIGNQYFCNFDPDKKSIYAYGTPRSMTKANNLLKVIDINDTKTVAKVIGGAIGQDAGENFALFLELTRKIDIDAILKDPKRVLDYTDDVGMIYNITLTVSDMAGDDNKKLGPMMYILRELKKHNKEYGAFMLKSYLNKIGKGDAKKGTKEFISRIGDALKKDPSLAQEIKDYNELVGGN